MSNSSINTILRNLRLWSPWKNNVSVWKMRRIDVQNVRGKKANFEHIPRVWMISSWNTIVPTNSQFDWYGITMYVFGQYGKLTRINVKQKKDGWLENSSLDMVLRDSCLWLIRENNLRAWAVWNIDQGWC